MAWLSVYNYRKKITITGQTGAGTDYVVTLLVGESSGAAGEDFDVGGHCTDFPNDIRFTEDDGITELSHYLQTVSGVTPNRLATFRVKVSDSLESSADIYIYYRNYGFSSASDGDNTFLLFEDFEDGIVGNAPAGWSILDGGAADVTIQNVPASGSESDGKCMRITSGNAAQYVYATKDFAQQTDVVVEGWVYYSATVKYYGIILLDNVGTIGIQDNTSVDGWNYRINHNGSVWETYNNYDKEIWYYVQMFTQIGSDTHDMVWSVGGPDYDLDNKASIANILTLRLGNAGGFSDGLYYIDDIRVRKYVSPEPAFDSAGEEENAGYTYVCTCDAACYSEDMGVCTTCDNVEYGTLTVEDNSIGTDVIAKTMTKNLIDGAIVSDSYSRIAQFFRTFTDGAIVSDSYSRIAQFFRTFTDGTKIADSTAKTVRKSLTDGIKCADIVTKGRTILLSFSDGVKIAETVVGKWYWAGVGAWSRSLKYTINLLTYTVTTTARKVSGWITSTPKDDNWS